VWIKRFQNKTQAEEATEKILKDAFIRSRNTIRVLKTDGDGIFGRSKTFQEMREREKFTHERPAPYDHKQSAIIDRECRTILEAVNTAIEQSGAPPDFWGHATDHFIFNVPRINGRRRGKLFIKHRGRF